MSISKKTALELSLGAIAASWIYQISRGTNPTLPPNFSTLVVTILISKLAIFAAIYLLLRLGREDFGALWVTGRDWPKHLGLGLAIGFAMFIALNVALGSVMQSLLPRPPSNGPSIMDFFQARANLAAWMPIGIFGGGVVEELQRIFVLTRFEKWLGRPGLILGVIMSSVMFGFGHLYQGLGIAIGTAISGVTFSLVYLRRRNAIEVMAAHALSDVLAMLAATFLMR
ncbi:MAG: CPBP family intramembrane glutamic endopeptidase [Chthoniobacterales bacterium]